MVVDPLFNMHKIRFNILDELVSKNCSNITDGSKINIFINFEMILASLYNPDTEKYLRMSRVDKVMEFTSNIINLAAHYRLFFAKHKLFSRVFIYLGYPFDAPFKNRNINPSYRYCYKNKYENNVHNFSTHDILTESITQARIIMEYINNVYFITSDIIEPSIIPHILNTDDTTEHINFIVTKDTYDYQYANSGFYILRPKKDDSYLLSSENIIDVMKQENNIKTEGTIDSNYIPFILSLLGSRKRNIEKIKGLGFGRLFITLKKAVDKGVLPPNVYSATILADLLKEDIRPELLNNYYCTDILTQYKMLNYRDKHLITSQVVDKFDNDGLMKMNDMYLRSNPINLTEISSGDKYFDKSKKKVDVFNLGR